jgi:hypothetical protein
MFQGPKPQRIVAPPSAAPPPRGPAPIPILAGDILPDEATKDPAYKEGGGARYAANQPHLAQKYGVIRGGRRIPPQQLATPGAKGLSEKTLDDMKTIEELQKTRGKAEADNSAEHAAATGPAGAAGRLGNSPEEGPQTRPRMSNDEKVERLKRMDDFDFNAFREAMMKDILNNDDQRKIIEARCKPMDITDLIVQGFVTQRVPVIPDKFELEFQSMRGDEDLAIKRLIMIENKGVEVAERYLLDKFSIMGVTIGLAAVGNNPLPTHLDNDGRFNEDAFWEKYEIVSRFPFHMLASIGVNYYWFDIRVRSLFVADSLGNG